MNLSNKNILVTGSEGFIGSHLVESLIKKGANVFCFVLYNSFNNWGNLELLENNVKKNLNIIMADIRDEKSVRDATKNIDIVFHLAALIAIPYSYKSPYSYIDTNLNGTLNILQACRDFDVEYLIHTSTSEVYGSALYAPIDENHPLQAQSPYAASKIAADMLVQSYNKSFETRVNIIRPFNTYGPRQSNRAVIPTIMSQILEGKDKIKLGNLNSTRDLSFVKDTVEGFLKVMQYKKTFGEVFNIASSYEISIHDLAYKILNLCNKKAQIIVDQDRIRPQRSEVNRLVADIKKAENLLNYEQKYTLEEGLLETISWVEKNLSKFKVDMYTI